MRCLQHSIYSIHPNIESVLIHKLTSVKLRPRGPHSTKNAKNSQLQMQFFPDLYSSVCGVDTGGFFLLSTPFQSNNKQVNHMRTLTTHNIFEHRIVDKCIYSLYTVDQLVHRNTFMKIH